MTSTRSSKPVLFSALRQELRRMSVWLALFPFLGFVYALCHGLARAMFCRQTSAVAGADQTVQIYGSMALMLFAGATVAGAFFAVSAFRYLYSRRQSDFFLALPVARRTAYFVKWAAVQLILFLGYCGAALSIWLLPRMIPHKWHIQLDAGYGMRLLAVAFAATAAFYCICQLCAVTAGKVWQYWTLLIGVGGFLPFGLASYTELFPTFLSGLSQQPVRMMTLTSPLVYVAFAVQGAFRFRYLLLAALAVAVLSFFFGMYFYRHRSGECAEQAVSTSVIYVLATTGAALSLVCLPLLLSFKAYQYGLYALLCAAGIGVMVLLCTLVYYRRAVTPVAAVLSSTLMVGIVATVCLLGVQGNAYRNKVPDAADVVQVTVAPAARDQLVDLPDHIMDPADYTVVSEMTDSQELAASYTFTEPESVAAMVQLHKACIAAAETEELGNSGYKSRFTYQLKNGKTLSRTYTACNEDGQNVIRATKEYKLQQAFAQIGQSDLLYVTYNSLDSGDNYYGLDESLGEIPVDKASYYAAIRADFMALTKADWAQINLADPAWTTVSFTVYQVRPGTDEKISRQLRKMDADALRAYYIRYYNTHTDSQPPCPIVRSTVFLPAKSTTANRAVQLLQKDGYTFAAASTLPNAGQVERMLVAPILLDKDICRLGSSEDSSIFIYRPELFLGSQVLRKDYASLYKAPFCAVEDAQDIARTLAQVQPEANAFELLKKEKQGYAVCFITKDAKATQMFFVPTAYGYDAQQPVDTEADAEAFAID